MAEFAKKMALTGGAADRLSVLLTTAGWARADAATLVVRATKTNTASIYVGSADSVNASTGFELEPGDVYPIGGGGAVQLTQLYVYAAATQGLEVWLHS